MAVEQEMPVSMGEGAPGKGDDQAEGPKPQFVMQGATDKEVGDECVMEASLRVVSKDDNTTTYEIVDSKIEHPDEEKPAEAMSDDEIEKGIRGAADSAEEADDKDAAAMKMARKKGPY